jgi:Xaa-Pro aminopeptidase
VPEEEYKEREKKLRKIMEERKLDLLLIYGDEYRYGDSVYIANYKGLNIVEEAPYCVFFPLDENEKSAFFTGRFNIQPARQHARIKNVRCIWDMDEHLKGLARGKRYRRVAYTSEDILPQSVYERIRNGLPDATLEPASDIMMNLRLRKSDVEVKLMRKAGEVGDLGLKAAEEALAPGKITLWEVIAIAENAMRMNGGDNPWANMVGCGEELIDRVYLANNKKIKEGELTAIDIHPNYRFYCNDTARAWAVGKLPKEQEETLKAAGRVMKGVIACAKPGMTYKDLFNKERDLMREEGYGDYWLPYAEETRGHALGHGIGLDMVEWPRRYPRDWDIVLEPNMTLAIKSELHGFDWGGLRHETVILITKDGAEPLNKFHYHLVD